MLPESQLPRLRNCYKCPNPAQTTNIAKSSGQVTTTLSSYVILAAPVPPVPPVSKDTNVSYKRCAQLIVRVKVDLGNGPITSLRQKCAHKIKTNTDCNHREKYQSFITLEAPKPSSYLPGGRHTYVPCSSWLGSVTHAPAS
jgi:hypothetical protein